MHWIGEEGENRLRCEGGACGLGEAIEKHTRGISKRMGGAGRWLGDDLGDFGGVERVCRGGGIPWTRTTQTSTGAIE